MAPDPSSRWRVREGARFSLARVDPRSTAGAPGDKTRTQRASDTLRARLVEQQARLYAEHEQSLLIVLQAIDTGGKDGTIRNVLSGVNPQGVQVTSFKRPTDEELAHDFLWRVHAATPAHGHLAVFNRSHYEDVLVARVHELAPPKVIKARYAHIRAFEAGLADAGTRVVKLLLHISRDEQRARLQSRLDDPAKHWKFEAGDLAERERWPDYQRAFQAALTHTTTDAAPWFVIPADRKWYRDWAVLTVLTQTLDEMDPRYPAAADGLDGVVIPE
jgi:PPK2 family polyphosphate:nucleotide phosphotransferase